MLGAIVLIVLQVVLSSKAVNVAKAPLPLTNWLVNWTDPTVPLIGPGHLAGAASPASSGTPRRQPPVWHRKHPPAPSTRPRP